MLLPLFLLALGFYFGTEGWPWHSVIYYERCFWVVWATTWGLHHNFSWASCMVLVLIATALHDRWWQHTRHRHAYISLRTKDLPRLYPEAEGKALRLTDVIAAANKHRGLTGGLRQLLDWALGNTQHYQTLIRQILQGATDDELNYILCSTELPEILQYATEETEELLGADNRLSGLSTVSKAALVDALQKKGLRFQIHRQQLAKRIILSVKGRELTLMKSLLDIRREFHNLHKLVFTDFNDPAIQAEVLAHIREQGEALAGGAIKVLSDIDDTLLSSGGRWPAGIDRAYPRGVLYPGVLAFYRELDLGLFAHTQVKDEVLAGTDGVQTVEDEVEEEEEEDMDDASPSMISRCTTAFVNHTLSNVVSRHVTKSPSALAAVVPTASQAIQDAVASYTAAGSTQSLYRSCGLVFLSARPHVYEDIGGEHHFFKHVINPLQTRSQLHTIPALIPGTLSESIRPVLRTIKSLGRTGAQTWKAVGLNKRDKLREFSQLYPECSLVFVGDNGQGDLLAGEMVADDLGTVPLPGTDGLPGPGGRRGQVLSSFIHIVQPLGRGMTLFGRLQEEERLGKWKERNVHHFKTYVGAALLAYRAKLLSDKALKRVTSEAILDFHCLRGRRTQGTFEKSVRVDVETWGSWDWAVAQADLNEDIAAVAEELEISVPPLGTAASKASKLPAFGDMTKEGGAGMCPSMAG